MPSTELAFPLNIASLSEAVIFLRKAAGRRRNTADFC
jgi:hypothetical protein